MTTPDSTQDPHASSTRGGVTVRLARLADVELLAPLFDAYRQFYDAASDLRAARDFLAERLLRDESVILLATVEARVGDPTVAGFAQLYPTFSSLALGRAVVLNDLFVTPPCRRLGIARLLVTESMVYARRAGAVRIEIATHYTNRDALALYESEGFARDTEFVHLERAL
jgi:GNAT superfamily N-acetyltransferase